MVNLGNPAMPFYHGRLYYKGFNLFQMGEPMINLLKDSI